MTGTSVIGLKYKDGIILAADTGGLFLALFCYVLCTVTFSQNFHALACVITFAKFFSNLMVGLYKNVSRYQVSFL